MLDDYFKTPNTPVRLRLGSIGPHLDGFTSHLAAAGYAWFTIRQYVGGPVHLGRWMDRLRIPVASLDDDVMARFQVHLRRCRCLTQYRGVRSARSDGTVDACLRFLDYLRSVGIARPRAEPELAKPLREFEEWMRTHRGTAERTLSDYRHYISKLLATGVTVEGLDAKQLREHVLKHSQPRRARSQVMVRALRMFVRFLVATGGCKAHLDGAVPSVACWRLSSLPRYLPPADVALVIAACPPTAVGRRDRAVLLLLSRLGLRRGDLCRMRLDDLDWDHGRVRVGGKTGRTVWLPLPQIVGDAIIGYLKHGRPRTTTDHVFVRAFAPYRALDASTFGNITSRAFARAGVSSPSKGTHIFRHTAATDMLRQGASLDEIGLLLRHSSRDTTLQYAKVDVRLLRSIAQPWPGPTP
jgi:integrase/recombinase XerD